MKDLEVWATLIAMIISLSVLAFGLTTIPNVRKIVRAVFTDPFKTSTVSLQHVTPTTDQRWSNNAGSPKGQGVQTGDRQSAFRRREEQADQVRLLLRRTLASMLKTSPDDDAISEKLNMLHPSLVVRYAELMAKGIGLEELIAEFPSFVTAVSVLLPSDAAIIRLAAVTGEQELPPRIPSQAQQRPDDDTPDVSHSGYPRWHSENWDDA